MKMGLVMNAVKSEPPHPDPLPGDGGEGDLQA